MIAEGVRADRVLLVLLVVLLITATRNDQKRKKEFYSVWKMYEEQKDKVEQLEETKRGLEKVLKNSDNTGSYSQLYYLTVKELVKARADLRENFKYWYMITGSETVVPDKQLHLIGPSQASILRAENYILLFLGELHYKIPKKTKGMLVWNFFQKVDDQRDMKLFLEQSVAPRWKENTEMFEDSRQATIADIRRYVADCTSEKKEEKNDDCPFARTQVFSIDPRIDQRTLLYDEKEVREFFRKQKIWNYRTFLSDFQNRIFGTDDRFLNEKEQHLGLSQVIKPVRQILQEVRHQKGDELFRTIQKWYQIPNFLIMDLKSEFQLSVEIVQRDVSDSLLDLYAVCKLCLEMVPVTPNILYVGQWHLPQIKNFFLNHFFKGKEVRVKDAKTISEKSVLIQMDDMEGILDREDSTDF